MQVITWVKNSLEKLDNELHVKFLKNVSVEIMHMFSFFLTNVCLLLMGKFCPNAIANFLYKIVRYIEIFLRDLDCDQAGPFKRCPLFSGLHQIECLLKTGLTAGSCKQSIVMNFIIIFSKFYVVHRKKNTSQGSLNLRIFIQPIL